MNVKEYLKKLDVIAKEDKNEACCMLVEEIRNCNGLTEQAVDLLTDRLEELLIDGVQVYASLTKLEGGIDVEFNYVTDENGDRWIYALLNESDLENIKDKDLFTKVDFLLLLDLILKADNDCGIELIASAQKSLIASPNYLKVLASRIEWQEA